MPPQTFTYVDKSFVKFANILEVFCTILSEARPGVTSKIEWWLNYIMNDGWPTYTDVLDNKNYIPGFPWISHPEKNKYCTI